MGLFGAIKKGLKTITKPIAKITGNKFVQAAVPVLAINSSITASTARGGPKAGFKAAENALKNPVIRKTAQATAMVFPAALPVVAAQEAAISTLNAVKSKNPQIAAGALLQVAATTQLAKSGNPGAQRALGVLKGVTNAKKLLAAAAKSAPGPLKKALEARVSKTPAAMLLYMRSVDRGSTSKNPKLRAAASKAKTQLLRDPKGASLLKSVQSGRQVNRTLLVRQFTVSRQGRVLKNGALLRGR